MKTLTEFVAFTLKNAHKAKQELIAAGKTVEELPAALGEALKLEGDKLNWLMGAMEAAGEKMEHLKRVVVWSTNEGEKAPAGAKTVGDKHFMVENFPPKGHHKMDTSAGDDRDGKRGGNRGDKRGGGDKRGAGGGRPAGGEGRGPGRGPGAGGERGAGFGGGAGGGGGRGPRPAVSTGPVSLPKPLATPKAMPAKPSAPAADASGAGAEAKKES
jgi:hypothetical protein